jgi:YHS domain-containing protein
VTDPEFALFHLQRALWDPVEPTRVGSLAPELRTRVNGEWYRFADPGTLARFRRRPALYCGLLRDPVTGMRFRPTARSPRTDPKEGGPYFFTSDSTRAEFLRDPKRYEVKRAA